MKAMRSIVLVAVALLTLAGCTESPTLPEFQVIEEVTFASELDIDLSTFSETGNGTYFKDIVVGDGDPAIYGESVTITFTGWLVDGTEFVNTTYTFLMGNNRVPVGLEDGMLNQRVGGTRKIIVPPHRGLGGNPQAHPGGNVIVPGGSVLVYEVALDAVE